MSSSLLRLRRAVSISSSLLRRRSLTLPISSLITHQTPTLSYSRHFRSSHVSLSSARPSFRNNNNNNSNLDDEIGPDTILFEGCDYNHWLITMDFPKDPEPTREEMIETYLNTLAKVVGSYEEAKKKMYACSTTTYQGFQCLVSEEESEKFKGLPGVVFVLPDSYIDPVNKEYGGDKYDNGIITYRPPPMQYGRQGGRYGDRNRDFNRPRQMPNEQGTRGYDDQGPRYGNGNFGQQQNPSVPHQQGNRGYDNQGPRYGDNGNFGQQHNPQVPNQQPDQAYANQGPTSGVYRNFRQEQNPPMQPNFGPTAGGERKYPLQTNNPQVLNQQPMDFGQEQNPLVQRNYGPTVGERGDSLPRNSPPPERDAMPPYRGSNFNQNQQEFNNPQGERVSPEQRGYTGDNWNYAPTQGVTPTQGAGGNYGQIGGGNGQGSGGNHGQVQGGSHVKGGFIRNHPQSFNYQKDPGYEGGNMMAPMEEMNNAQAQQRSYGQIGQTGEYQGRY